MEKVSDVIDYLWKIGWFKEFRSPKEIKDKIYEESEIYVENITPILKLKRFNKKIKRFSKGWRQIRPPKEKGIKKKSNLKEIKDLLGSTFEKEMNELEIVSVYCPNCMAFLMRKILEKLLFITISKSNNKNKIKKIKQTQKRLPNLTELLRISSSSEIDDKHILAPKNIDKLEGSKFLGDTAAHDYLTNVSFEDINNEISVWRVSIKQLSESLNSAKNL